MVYGIREAGPEPSSAATGAPAAASAATPIPPEVIQASLRYSIQDGVAWSVMIGAGERYVQPFVILGGSSLFALAAVAALPNLVGAVVQWFGANVTDSVGRRKLIFTGSAALQAVTWIPMCIAILLPSPWGYGLMLAAFVVYMALSHFGTPAWNSVMGDLVPPAYRGRYFGLRNLLVGSVVMLSFLGAGCWLAFWRESPRQFFGGMSSLSFGFLTLFVLAGAMRVVSAWYLSRMYEPQYRRQPSDAFSLWDFIRRAPRAHFGRFVMYCALIYAGFGLVSPFFNWYVLDQLHYSTVSFAWLGAVQMAALYGSSLLIGHFADRFGNKWMLSVGGLAMIGFPLLLMVSSNLYYLLAIQIYDGVAWSAFNIAAGNYLFDIVTPAKRARCTAYYNLFIALGTAVGTFGGAAVAALIRLPWNAWGINIVHPFTVILICAVAVRLLPNVLLLRSFREWRLRAPA